VSQREHCRIPLKIKYGKEYVVRYLMRITEENDNDTCQLNQLSIKSIKFKYIREYNGRGNAAIRLVMDWKIE